MPPKTKDTGYIPILNQINLQILATLIKKKKLSKLLKRHKSELYNKANHRCLNQRRASCKGILIMFYLPTQRTRGTNRKLSNHASGQISFHKIISNSFHIINVNKTDCNSKDVYNWKESSPKLRPD